MKTCKNCSTINPVSAVKCITCKIENHFTLHAAPREEVVEVKEIVTLQCINCGSHESAEVIQCTQCKFPLSLVSAKPISKLAQINRKVG